MEDHRTGVHNLTSILSIIETDELVRGGWYSLLCSQTLLDGTQSLKCEQEGCYDPLNIHGLSVGKIEHNQLDRRGRDRRSTEFSIGAYIR
jgi:hypothetical protein